MAWIDSHCHLDFLNDPPRDMARAEDAGIGHWLLPGTDPGQWHRARERFKSNSRVWLAFGHHPWYLPETEPALRSLSQALNGFPAVVALGEIGLDFHPGPPSRPTAEHQEAWFDSQLQLARELGLPVIVHSVKAHDRVLHYLKRYPDVTGVIHAFLGPYDQAMAFVDKGWYLGCGSLIFKSPKTLDAFKRIPVERLLLETDAPDMRPPRPVNDNPLLDLLQIGRKLAEARGISEADLMAGVARSGEALFGVPHHAQQ